MISIAERLAALRAANEPEPMSDYDENDQNRMCDWYIHREVFKTHLELAGRTDIDYLCSRPADEWREILAAVERDPKCTMRFGYDNK